MAWRARLEEEAEKPARLGRQEVDFAFFFIFKHFETTSHNVGKGGLDLLSSWPSNPDVLGLQGAASTPGSGLPSFVSSPLKKSLENFLLFFFQKTKINLLT